MIPKRTLALVAAVALAAAGSGVAAAAPRSKPKLCNLVTDKGGDVTTGNQSLDVVSGDIATTPKLITAVIRFTKLAQQDLTSPTGRYLEFTFAYEGRGQSLAVYLDPTGAPTWQKGATGKIDLAKNEVRITLPVDNLTGRPTLKTGAVFTNLLIRTDIGNPAYPIPSSFLLAGDAATGTKPYPIHAPSCVVVGA